MGRSLLHGDTMNPLYKDRIGESYYNAVISESGVD
jgi:hypothetical protein